MTTSSAETKRSARVLHDLVEFAYNTVNSEISADDFPFIFEALRVFGKSIFHHSEISEDVSRGRIVNAEVIETVVPACAEVIRLLEVLCDMREKDYHAIYTTPGFMGIGVEDDCFQTFPVFEAPDPNRRETMKVFDRDQNLVDEFEYSALCGDLFIWASDLPKDRIKRCAENGGIRKTGKVDPPCNRIFVQKTAKNRDFCCDYHKNNFILRKKEANKDT